MNRFLLLLISLAFTQNSFAQVYRFKELPKASFKIYGTTTHSFPVLTDYSEQGIANYAKLVDTWISSNKNSYQNIILYGTCDIKITGEEFEMLEPSAKQAFKDFGKRFQPIFDVQNKYLEELYPQKIEKGALNGGLPYYYLMNASEVYKWRKFIGI